MAAKIEIQLGNRIKELRRAAGLSQVEVARLMGKSIETISNFERGKTVPSVRTLALLAIQLNCAMADFFRDIDKAKSRPDGSSRVLSAKAKMLDAKDRKLLLDFADLLARRSRR